MSTLCEVWPGVFAHSSGGLWLEESRTLALADVHLGYGWAQRRRGQLGPLVDQQTASKVNRVLDELSPRKLLLVGDIVHAPKPGVDEFAFIQATLTDWAGRAELICLKGNHDRQFESDFGLALVAEWRDGLLRLIHGDRLQFSIPDGERLVIGHLHPAIGLEDAAGVRQRVPAFLVAGPVLVMPAFSPFAAGMDVWKGIPEEIERLSNGARPEAIAATGNRVVRLGPLDRLVSPASGTKPRDYRASK